MRPRSPAFPSARAPGTSRSIDDSYAASAVGGTTGILKTIANGSGTGEAQGRIVNGALVPANYKASTTTSRKSETIHITLAGGNVKEFGIDPEPPVDADRIPVTDAHKKGVLDPMTSSLVRVPGNGDPVSPEACRGSAAVFDGRLRYDLKLDFKRMETVKSDRGYHGPVVVCAVYFIADRGLHPRPSRDQISRRRPQHRDRFRADRGHAGAGPLPDGDPDPARHRHAGSDPIHDPGRRRRTWRRRSSLVATP